jgi:ribose transport system ATP-binding protein
MEKGCILKMENISVLFPGVKALDDVSLDVQYGEVHILIGENGAGKSTLMKVLVGVNSDYSGKVFFKGHEIKCSDIQQQRERGISMIFQEINLLPNITVAEAIFMERHQLTKLGSIDWKQMGKDTRRLLDSIGSDVSERSLIKDLTVGQMQMVEIAKSLSFEASIVIMDEPTSALSEKETEQLFEIIEKLKTKGVSVIYISHRMEEIMRIGDRITIFRDGKYIKTMMTNETTIDEIISLMVGRVLTDYYPRVSVPAGEKVIEVKNLNSGKILHNISFYARSGEITGFYGLMGAGRTELMRAIFGADKFDSGEILIHNRVVDNSTCVKAKKNGMAFLTEDRKNQGLILGFDLSANISLSNLPKIMNFFGINHKLEEKNNLKLVDLIKIKTSTLKQKVRNLSGGNQQKVVIAKWLNTDFDIILFDEPTRGIDVGSKVEIYKIMNSLKQKNKSVIMVSSELTECMKISDRLYIMHEGRITAEIAQEELSTITEDKIIRYATDNIQPKNILKEKLKSEKNKH